MGGGYGYLSCCPDFGEMAFILVFGNAEVIQFEVESPKNVKILW